MASARLAFARGTAGAAIVWPDDRRCGNRRSHFLALIRPGWKVVARMGSRWARLMRSRATRARIFSTGWRCVQCVRDAALRPVEQVGVITDGVVHLTIGQAQAEQLRRVSRAGDERGDKSRKTRAASPKHSTRTFVKSRPKSLPRPSSTSIR